MDSVIVTTSVTVVVRGTVEWLPEPEKLPEPPVNAVEFAVVTGEPSVKELKDDDEVSTLNSLRELTEP